MILVSVSSYSQYPQIKKIKQDSVVIMTIEQGKEINALYIGYNNTIDSLKNKIKDNDSLLSARTIEKDSLYSWKHKYKLNKSLYEDFEANQKKIDKLHASSKLILIFIILLQFSQL
jgi:hypothetical protein